MIKDPPIKHERTAEVYSAYSSSRECQIRIRRDQTLQAKLCTGKYKGLRACKSLLDGSDPTCPLCNQEPQDLQHWLQRCQATEKLRFNLFGLDSSRVGLPDKAPCTGNGPGDENPLLGAILRFLLAQGN